MQKLLAIAVAMLFSQLAWSFQNRIDGIDDTRAAMGLRLAGISLDDQTALIGALHRPFLAASAAYALAKLPKNDLVIRELNQAALADDEHLMTASVSTLSGFGDTQWVAAVRGRFPTVRNKLNQLLIAARQARAGVYDGWDLIESTIPTKEPVYRDIALLDLYDFRDCKDAFGRPI